MTYCGPRGIELDAFLRWSPASQAAALAWDERAARRCNQCGTDPDEWADDPHAFHAHLSQCKGCQERQRVSESPEARNGGQRGVSAVVVSGSAGACPRCQPLDDD